MRITIIAGARPNFIKIAPLVYAIEMAQVEGKCIKYRLVHTGQHYDKNMSGSFFEQLGIPQPDVNLESGGGSQAEQSATIMVRFEKELQENPADLVLVVGDVNSTMACAITAQKLQIKVAHVEAGIRSGDWGMPEEINRLVTDSITNYFFTTTEIANQNLIKEGVSKNCIFLVGNTMIDTLLKQESNFRFPDWWLNVGVKNKEYLVMTLHRPSNVDSKEQLNAIFRVIAESAGHIRVIFPVHPRTRNNMKRFGLQPANVLLVDPLGYLEFNWLVKNAKGVITDSGGITEETTVMGIPCMTLRNTTERPETCTIGTNELLGTDPSRLAEALDSLMAGNWKKGGIPPLWDGKTAERIVKHICEIFNVAEKTIPAI